MATIATTVSSPSVVKGMHWQCQDCSRSISSEEGEMYGRCHSCFTRRSNSVAIISKKNVLSAVTLAAGVVPAAQAFKHVYCGHIFYARGEMFSAIVEYGKAIKLSPNFAVAYVNRGFALLRQGRNAKAQGDFKQAIILDPSLNFQIEERIRVMCKHRAAKF